jgi:hypothetical protein
MIGVMPATKFAVSFAPELYESMQAAAREDGASVSQWVADAVARRLRQRALQESLEDWQKEYGPITEADMDAVRHEWQD